MKVYISADIEGIAGITHWDEATPGHGDYPQLQTRMTTHVAAACEGALAAGATEILVKDAHASGRNLLFDRLPRQVQLVRGWSEHPLQMVQELDSSFAALALVGYHAGAGSGGNPLAHTLSSSRISLMLVNGMPVSEFHLFGWAAGQLGVPVALVSGDEALCQSVREISPHITTVPVTRGVGGSSISVHPQVAEAELRRGMEQALGGELGLCRVEPPDRPVLELHYRTAAQAHKASFYPGAELVEARTVRLAVAEYMEILRALVFLASL